MLKGNKFCTMVYFKVSSFLFEICFVFLYKERLQNDAQASLLAHYKVTRCYEYFN